MPIVWTFGFTLSSHKKYHYCPRLTTSLTGFGGKVNRQNEHHTLIIPHLTDEGEQYQLKCDPDSFYGFCTLYCAKFNYFLPDFLFSVKNVHKLHSFHTILWEMTGQTTDGVRGSWRHFFRLRFCWIYRTISIRLPPLSWWLEGRRARLSVKMSQSQIVNINILLYCLL